MRYQRGFTLVELSIVLVIIGLLVGGILASQSLLRGASIRSVTTQSQKIIAANQLFVSEYSGLPGDLRNAQDFWGIAHATPATCATTVSTNETTCNGDGNGAIAASTGSVEHFRFWQHLANAGFIEGRFTGATSGSNNFSATSVNSPSSRLAGAGWSVFNFGTQVGDVNSFYAGVYDNAMMFGGFTANNLTTTSVMLPEEMRSIDIKIDDGKPGTGALLAYNHGSCTLSGSGLDYSSDYDLTVKNNACVMIWPRIFRLN